MPRIRTLLLLAAGVGAVALRRRRKINDARFNRRARITIVLAIAVSIAQSQASSAAHAAEIRTVFLSGQQAPGMPDGVVFSQVVTSQGMYLTLNDAGQTAFYAQLRTGSGIDLTNRSGIWSEGSGSLARVVNNSSGGQVRDLVLNDAGQTAFFASLPDGQGIWSDRSGSLELVARGAEQAPGTPDGVSFYGPGFEDIRLNNAGQIAFRAVLTDSSVPFPNYGIWSEGSGTLALVARQGDQAPGMPSGMNFNGLIFNSLALNDAGQTAFSAQLIGAGVDGFNNDASIWSGRSGSLVLVAREGDQAPGMPSGVTHAFSTSFLPLNDSGHTAFSASLSGSGVDSANNDVIWSEGSGSLAIVAREGDPAPGAPSGVTFQGSFFNGSTFGTFLVLNDAGQTAFSASLAGSGVDTTNDRGIWLEDSGSLALIARKGDHAPGTPDGVNFSGGTTFTSPGGRLQLNDAGQIAFFASLTGNGIDSTNNSGIWATDRSGDLQLIAREGGVLELAPGDFRTIREFYGDPFTTSTGNSDGRRSLFNNRGQLAFAAIFTDGTSGIFVSNRVAVPEPSTLPLLGCAAGAALVLRRRSGQASRLLVATMIGAVTFTPNAASAASTTFQFATSIDTTIVGGGPGTPLTVTYTFDSELANGAGPFFPDLNLGSYGPLAMQIQIGDQTVSAGGGGISVFNDTASPLEDGYDVRPGDGPESFTGQLFGMDILFFRFLLVDNDHNMFDSTALPQAPGFATATDFQQTGLDLYDEELGQRIPLGIIETPETPPEQRTQFSLTLVSIPEPSALVLVAAGIGVVTLRRRHNSRKDSMNDARFNRRMRSTLLAIVVSAALPLSPIPAHAAEIRTVFLSGQQAPGMPEGAVFSRELVSNGFYLALNDAGQTAFQAQLTGSGVDSTNRSGIWSEGSGSLARVVNLSGRVRDLVLNDAGQTAFDGELPDGRGIWSDRSGSLALVAREGDPAPGMPSGVTYGAFQGLRLNNTSQIAFAAFPFGSGVGGLNDGGIWSEGSGSLSLVARHGQQAHGMPDGVNLSINPRNQTSYALNDAGQTAFSANITDSAGSPTFDTGIWATDRTGALQLLVRDGDHPPGAPIAVSFGPSYLAINNAGQVAFSNGYTIWSQGSGSLTLVARDGDHAPGTPSGVTFHGTFGTFGSPVLNDAGQTAFNANLADSDGVQIGTGIWSEGSGTLALVAREGDHAPGTSDGVNFSSFPIGQRLILNAAGQTAFSASLTGNGIDSTNNFGIWATDRSGDLQLIAREGGVLEVAPGDFRSIRDFYSSPFTTSTGNSDGRHSLFNNRGQLAFAAFFTDGSSGIFVSNRVAVPEPGTLLLAAAGIGVIALRRRRKISSAWSGHCARFAIALTLVVGESLSQSTTPAHAADLRTVALRGQQAPGVPDGVTYLDLLGPTILNDAGQTSFVAYLVGSDVADNNNEGIWSEGSGSLALVVRKGAQAPGAASGVNFSRFVGNAIVLNDAGQTAFLANVVGSGVAGSNGAGLWSQGSGSLMLVARGGSQAPGVPTGVTYSSFGPFVLNNIGQTAFSASLAGVAVDSTSNGGIWSEGSGSLALVARSGSQAAGTASGVNFANLASSIPVLNDAGQTAFGAGLIGVGVDSTNNAGIWSEGSGGLALIGRKGDQAPGVPGGVTYSFFSYPELNDAGQTAFSATVTGTGVDSTNNRGIWSEGTGTLALVARSGDQAPGTPSGVIFNGFGTTTSDSPVLNDIGQIAFVADLMGSGVDSLNNRGIWSNGSGSLALVVREGDHAPGTPDGTKFYGFGSVKPVLNVAGQAAFFASLTGSNVDFANEQGIWATDRHGVMQLIAREGDPLEVAPGDFRTINNLVFAEGIARGGTGNGDGRPSGFNNLGQVAFKASFTDGSSGIFVSDRVAVPEPSTLLLLGFGSLAALRRWRGFVCAAILAGFVGFLCAERAAAVTIDTVPVGNPGNAGEVQSQGTFGAVDYNYRIGETEVTNAQYVEFLNGVDPTGVNSLALYSGSMTSDARGGINFNGGAANGSKYEIKSGRDDNPVVLVSWYDSIRFANWLHNGQGAGNTEEGAYTLLGGTPTPSNGNSITRNVGAKWWLPSEDEWYKAAYHKNDGATGNYWEYPTSTDAVPFSDQPPGSGAPTQSNTANYRKTDSVANGYDDGYAVTGSDSLVGSQNYLTDVGAYTLSTSPYGTFDQGGNVFEWNEALISAPARGLRGGSWFNGSGFLLASSRNFVGSFPTVGGGVIGFRVAGIPEPNTLLLLCLGSLAVLWRRRGLVCASILAAVFTTSSADRARGESIEWVRQLGTSSPEFCYGVSADGLGNVYISGWTPGGSLGGPSAGGNDAFVSKYDAAGTLQWSRQLGTSAAELCNGVSADGLGNVYISGRTNGSLGGPNAGSSDAFVSKYDAAGNFQWTQQLGTSGWDESRGVSADGLGSVYISGYTSGSLGGPNACCGNDAFVSKYDTAGTLQWSRQLGTSGGDSSYSVSADGLGNVYISGYTQFSLGGPSAGSFDAFVSKYDTAGTLQWSRQLGTSAYDESLGVSADGLGNVYISGRTEGSLGGPSAGGRDAFVSKYDAAGTLQWSRQLGPNSFDESRGVSTDGLGNVYFSGFTTGSLGGPNAGSYDAFVVKIVDSVVPEPNTLLLLCFGSLAVWRRRRGLVCASVLAAVFGIVFVDRAEADTFGSGANQFDIEFVSIGNPGNSADDVSANPDFAGSVPYTYRIGKFEISEQMIDNANSEGGLGITKTIRGADKPATQVGWNEAARFVNWLNTSTGSPLAYKFASQPGEVGYNANADIELWTTSDAGYNPNNLYRNSLARYFLPSVDEWYKAAYYDPTSGVYYDYPAGSDTAPTAVASTSSSKFLPATIYELQHDIRRKSRCCERGTGTKFVDNVLVARQPVRQCMVSLLKPVLPISCCPAG